MTRAFLLGLVLLATACSSHKSFESLCANQVSPPMGCNTSCDPAAGASSCPIGFHCSDKGKCDTFCTLGGDECGAGYSCTSDGNCVPGDNPPCVGLECNIARCKAMGKSPTTISGTVFAPNGTLPLYGVSVYVPNTDPGSFKSGVQCGACSSGLPGDPLVQATTDETGSFTLENVPSGSNIPVVITIGKWRRQLKLTNVEPCTTQQLAPVDTALPKSRDDVTPNTTSVDMPQIAISTGSADALECLVRRLGIADKEITTDAQGGKIHLFADTQAIQGPNGVGVKNFDLGFGGGLGNFNDSQTLWGTATNPGKLSDYDIVLLSCETAQHAETKPQAAMDHLKAYADLGGRVFLSHWHNIWITGSTQAPTNGAKPMVWSDMSNTEPMIATFTDNTILSDGTVDTIDEDPHDNPKGMSFASWMSNVGGSPARGIVPIQDKTGKQTCHKINPQNAEQWVYWQMGQTKFPQMFQFTTPIEMPQENRCGKVVFSDMHVSAAPLGGGYPTSCGNTTTLTQQEKALAFMFFDISSCVGVIQ